MKSAFASKMSYFILTFIFLIITASFLFSGFAGSSKFTLGANSNVATVDGTPVTTKEYQMALARQIEFFNQMMGGNVTQQQLEAMGVKQSVLNGLIQQKLVLNAASEIGLVVSSEEIKNDIKNLPYFKSANRFDPNLYRNVLQSNGYVPAQFEELVGNDLKQKKVDELFNTTLISDNFVKDIVQFKNNAVTVHALKISRQSLSPLVSVSQQEITQYLGNPANQKALEAAYTDNLAKYVKAEEVKARHILITGDKAEAKIKELKDKVNAKNFAAIASKETQDPTGKDKGGELGWFSKGRMVPEFDDVAFKLKVGEISAPVKTQFGYHLIFVEGKKAAEEKKLESVKQELAQLAIQKTKAQDLDKLLASEQERLTKSLQNNDLAAAEATAKKVEGQFSKAFAVNQFDQSIANSALSPKEAEELFKAAPGTVLNFGNAGTIYLVKVVSRNSNENKDPAAQLKTEATAQNQALSRKIREDLIKAMNNKAKIVTNPSLM